TVCPWNEKAFGPMSEPSKDMREDIKWILQSSNKKILKALKGSPLLRAGARGLKRNAIIVAVNSGYQDLIEDIKKYSDHKDFLELVRWALETLHLRAQCSGP